MKSELEELLGKKLRSGKNSDFQYFTQNVTEEQTDRLDFLVSKGILRDWSFTKA